MFLMWVCSVITLRGHRRPGFDRRRQREGSARVRTWGVELALLQERLVDDQGRVAGQLEEPADQAIGRIVFVGNEFQMVHVLYRHLETKRLQREIFNEYGTKFPVLRKHLELNTVYMEGTYQLARGISWFLEPF